jgi:hypothetical protein
MISRAPGLYDLGLINLPAVTARQNCEQWCWAASLETIFNVWGVPAVQEDFVRLAFRALVCRPASDDLMLSCIDNRFENAKTGQTSTGKHFVARGQRLADDGYWWHVVVTELSNGRPLLAAYRTGVNSGHAVVITHIRVQYFGDGTADIQSITVRDPWPASPNRRSLTLEEAKQLRFIAAVSFTRT